MLTKTLLRRIYYLFIALFGMMSPGFNSARADVVNLAVASNFSAPIKKIIPAFEQQTGHRVLLTLGSSGRFFAQINHGAPFHVFLSADSSKPRALAASAMGLTDSRFTYAVGALALWSARDDLIQNNSEILKKSSFRKIAIASPKLAPYGHATIETLQSLGLYDVLSPKFVRGENIAQTYQFVATGNAELGFISVSQVFDKGKLQAGSVWLIPPSLHQQIRQDAILMTSARNNQAAIAFMQFLKSGSAKEIIRNFGYHMPTEGE